MEKIHKIKALKVKVSISQKKLVTGCMSIGFMLFVLRRELLKLRMLLREGYHWKVSNDIPKVSPPQSGTE